MTVGPVTLSFAADPSRVRLARLVAAAMADGLGFGYDEVEDVRIGVDELCFWLLNAAELESEINVTFEVHADRLEIKGEGQFATSKPDPAVQNLTELTTQILSTVADDYGVEVNSNSGRFFLRKNRL